MVMRDDAPIKELLAVLVQGLGVTIPPKSACLLLWLDVDELRLCLAPTRPTISQRFLHRNSISEIPGLYLRDISVVLPTSTGVVVIGTERSLAFDMPSSDWFVTRMNALLDKIVGVEIMNGRRLLSSSGTPCPSIEPSSQGDDPDPESDEVDNFRRVLMQGISLVMHSDRRTLAVALSLEEFPDRFLLTLSPKSDSALQPSSAKRSCDVANIVEIRHGSHAWPFVETDSVDTSKQHLCASIISASAVLGVEFETEERRDELCAQLRRLVLAVRSGHYF